MSIKYVSPITGPEVTDELLSLFVADQQARYDAYISRQFGNSNFHKTLHDVTIGKRYARVCRKQYSNNGKLDENGSVVCFIDMRNGDILKAGSWKAPAPNGVRGNLYTDDRGASCMSEWGTRYLRG